LIFLLTFTSSFAQQPVDSLNPIQLSSVGVRWVKPSGEEIFSASNVGRKEIEENMGNGSVNNMFDMVPSMITTSDAGTGIGYTYMRIRGIDQTRINVTMNGIAVNDAESQGTWFVNLPDFGSHVENLEVQRGVGTSNNGSAAFGASMNFSTLDIPSKAFLELNSSAGSFYTFRNSVSAGTGLIADRFSAAFSYSNILSRGYIDRANAKLNSIFFTANYRLLNKKKGIDYGNIKFNVIYGNEKTGLAWNGVPSDSLKTNRTYNDCGLYYDDKGNPHYYDNETDNYEQTHYQLFYNIERMKPRKSKTGFHKYNFDLAGHLTRGIGYYEQYKDNKKFSAYGLDNFEMGDDILKKT
ncbi:MAG: TonB-dependent receptor plug domain-containing protein, partial [Bacteroidales bacterium]